MAGKRFLSGIRSSFLTGLDDPLFPSDAANKSWVEALLAAVGISVPAGGAEGQVLTKVTGMDYDTAWETPAASDFGNSNMSYHGGGFTTQNNGILTGGTF